MSILLDFLKALSISQQKRNLFTDFCTTKISLDKNKVVKSPFYSTVTIIFNSFSKQHQEKQQQQKPCIVGLVYRRLNKRSLFPLEAWQATQSCGILLRIFTDHFSNFPGRNDLRINIKVKFTSVTRDIKDKVFKKFVRID